MVAKISLKTALPVLLLIVIGALVPCFVLLGKFKIAKFQITVLFSLPQICTKLSANKFDLHRNGCLCLEGKYSYFDFFLLTTGLGYILTSPQKNI